MRQGGTVSLDFIILWHLIPTSWYLWPHFTLEEKCQMIKLSDNKLRGWGSERWVLGVKSKASSFIGVASRGIYVIKLLPFVPDKHGYMDLVKYFTSMNSILWNTISRGEGSSLYLGECVTLVWRFNGFQELMLSW